MVSPRLGENQKAPQKTKVNDNTPPPPKLLQVNDLARAGCPAAVDLSSLKREKKLFTMHELSCYPVSFLYN